MNAVIEIENETDTEAQEQAQPQTLLEQFISRAEAATVMNYSELLTDLATHEQGGVLDIIETSAVLEALTANNQMPGGKREINKVYKSHKERLKPQRPSTGIDGGLGFYRLADDGVYQLTGGSEIRICSALEVLAMTRTPDGGGWGRMLEWQDNDYKTQRWAMPANLTAGDGNEVIRHLLERGLTIRPGDSKKNVIDYLMSVETDKRLYSTDRTGWHDGAFVTPEKVYGSNDYIFQSESAISAALVSKGTVQDWSKNVAQKAAGNSRIMFAISSAFAGSLLDGAGIDSGGFHLHGTSTDGKTTAQYIAASVWGNPKNYAQTWRATSNGLEGVAALHNDGLLILDEIGQANPKEIGDTAYMLANGQSKTRMTKTTANRKPLTWRLLFLSSGEYTLVDMMKAEGKRTFAGQEIRLANIPSDAGAGMGVFENIHGKKDPAQFADMLKQSIGNYHGTAGQEWLKYLTQHPEWKQDIQKPLSQLVQEVTTDVTQQGGRVALRFALVAQAGELATKAGITGWKKGEATKAAKTCYQAWLANFGKGDREHKNILEAVRTFIDGNPARFQKVYREGQRLVPGEERTKLEEARSESRPVAARVGFKIQENADDFELYILASNITECASGYTATQIKAALLAAGWIDSTIAHNKHIPGEKKPRCFKLAMSD